MGAQQSQSFGYDVAPQTLGGFSDAPLWSLHEGVRKVDSARVSVFVFDVQKQPDLAEVARNTMKRLKTLRHPSLVTYLDGLELPTTFYMVTEWVTPLRDVLPEIKANEHHLSWGLCQVLKGLQFLNTDCRLVHGNVTLSSIFVSKAGDWKLGGLEFVSSPSESLPALKKQLDLVDTRYHSPEVKRDATAALQKLTPHAIDMYMYGCLLYEIFNGPFQGQDDLIKTRNIPQSLTPQYRALISTPKGRPDPSQLATTCKYFSNPLVEALQFLENIALKDSHEKDSFFGKLGSQIDHFPKQLCTQKILPSLVTALDYGSASSRALGPLLKIGAQLPPDEYAARITPSVVKWFGSTDREMRTNLLSNIESFAEHLTPALVNEKIFINLALGFSDVSPKLRELTIRSIVILAPKLSAEILNTEVLRHFARLQLDKEPYIRTNTTICLGRIASHLAPATRKRVLTSAFSRSLRDPFPPARVAGLMAFTATHEYYEADEMAKKVVPCLSMLTVDPEKQVRTAALQALRLFVEKLEKHSESLAATSDSASSSSSDAGGLPSGPASAGAGGEGLLGWALGSITGSISKKIYGGEQQQPPLLQQQQQQQQQQRAGSSATKEPGGAGAGGTAQSVGLGATRLPGAAATAAAGGWSDGDDDDDDFFGGDNQGWGSQHIGPAGAPSTDRAQRVAAAAAGASSGWGADDDDWAKQDSDDDGWGDDDDDWGGVPSGRGTEDERNARAPISLAKPQPQQQKQQPQPSTPITATTATMNTRAVVPKPTAAAAAPVAGGGGSPSMERKSSGIPGLRRAEASKKPSVSSPSATLPPAVTPKSGTFNSSSSSSSGGGPQATMSFGGAASSKKGEPSGPARSLSTPLGSKPANSAQGAKSGSSSSSPWAAEEEPQAGGWGDSSWGGGAGGDDDDDWDFPAAPASPLAARGAKSTTTATGGGAGGLSKLEQRALLRSQKGSGGKKD